ncbi:heme utilization protein HutZ [Vibrio sp. HA2012]|nr:heme utilization protein HutZ [Vibrio sp. HA2012]
MGLKQEKLHNGIEQEIAVFRRQQRTLQLASITPEGLPHVSYSPFVYLNDSFYILVSDVAQHGENLKRNHKVSIMLIEDEQEAKSIYARKRLSYTTEVFYVEKSSELWCLAISELEIRFGDIISNLSKMEDFKLYQLVPEKGRFVKGFGQAFDIFGSDTVDLVHLKKGHKKTRN